MSRQDQCGAGARSADKYKSLRATRADPRQRQMVVAHTIRKNKRAETLTKRRMLIYHEATGGGGAGGGAAGFDGCDNVEHVLQLNVRDGEDAAVLMRMLADDANVSDQLLAVVHLRKVLTDPEAYLDDVMALDEGLVGKLLEMVSERDDQPRMQFEAAWVLTNLLSGAREPTLKIVDAGAVRVFVRKIESSTNVQLVDQCVWAIGNIVGDGAALRDVCMAEGGLDALCAAIVANHENEAFLRNATWALGHFFYGDPRAGRDVLEPVLDILEQLLQCDDIAVVSDAAWAFVHYTEGSDDECTDRIVDVAARPNVVARLSQLLVTDTANRAVTTPALRVLGNLITHPDDKCTDAVLDTDPLPALLVLLAGGEKSVRKEVCWLLSNVAAGSAPRHVAALLETDGLMTRIVSAMCTDVHDVKVEAAWCVCNTTVGANDEQIREFVTPNVFEGLFACMHAALAGDEALLLTLLMAVSNIMRASRGAVELNLTETYVDQIRNHLEDAVDLIVALQDHPTADVAAEAEYLVERWFHDVDDDSLDLDDTDATTSSSDADEDSEGDAEPPASSGVPLEDDDAAATAPAGVSAWKF